MKYLFYKENNTERLKYTLNSLPAKFFWHGETTRTTTIEGCYEADVTKDEDDKPVYPETPKSVTFTYIIPNTKITDISYCFHGNAMSAYKHTITADDVEINPDYSPFDYIHTAGRWTPNKRKNVAKYQFYYAFDGSAGVTAKSIVDTFQGKTMPDGTVYDTPNVKDFVELPDMYIPDKSPETKMHDIVASSNASYQQWVGDLPAPIRYFCPPDLFRYIAYNAKIVYVFYCCSKKENYAYGNLEYSETYKPRSWGLMGRFCPWLLKGLTNIDDATGMFGYIKTVPAYLDFKEKAWWIPPSFFSYTPNLKILTEMFTYAMIPAKTNLNTVFSTLKQSLTVDYIFFAALLPKLVDNVFSECDITKCSYAFAHFKGTYTATGLQCYQTITFSNCFKNYTSRVADTNFSHVFYGYASTVTHENPKTLPDEKNTSNYYYAC